MNTMIIELIFSKIDKGKLVFNRTIDETIDANKNGIKYEIKETNDNFIVYEMALSKKFMEKLQLKKGSNFELNFAIMNMADDGEKKFILWCRDLENAKEDIGYFHRELHFADATLK